MTGASTPDGDRFVVVRFQRPQVMALTGVTVPGFATLGSVIFTSLDHALDHARELDHAAVYQLQGPLAVVGVDE